jgi:hypothetical protein
MARIRLEISDARHFQEAAVSVRFNLLDLVHTFTFTAGSNYHLSFELTAVP